MKRRGFIGAVGAIIGAAGAAKIGPKEVEPSEEVPVPEFKDASVEVEMDYRPSNEQMVLCSSTEQFEPQIIGIAGADLRAGEYIEIGDGGKVFPVVPPSQTSNRYKRITR